MSTFTVLNIIYFAHVCISLSSGFLIPDRRSFSSQRGVTPELNYRKALRELGENGNNVLENLKREYEEISYRQEEETDEEPWTPDQYPGTLGEDLDKRFIIPNWNWNHGNKGQRPRPGNRRPGMSGRPQRFLEVAPAMKRDDLEKKFLDLAEFNPLSQRKERIEKEERLSLKLRSLQKLSQQLQNKQVGEGRRFSECVVEDVERKDCGYFGITRAACVQRGCCWKRTDLEGAPWCYHSLGSSNEQCIIDDFQREECGFYGIDANQCEDTGCCWRPTQQPNVPWCYQQQEVTPLVLSEGCGVPTYPPGVDGKIVGGNDATPHSWPWQVSLQSDGRHFCGGSLINHQWILTAAHCYPGFQRAAEDQRTVALGMHYRLQEEPSRISVGIDRIISHEDYDGHTYANDIMLLRLNQSVEYTAEISPVCLPELGFQVEQQSLRCYTTGWGDTKFLGSNAKVLQQVMVPLIERQMCELPSFYGDRIDSNMMCAGYALGARDSCQGDSGGPLVYEEDNRWVQLGIVSWGDGCASPHKPGVYTKVMNFVDWINTNIADPDES